MAASSSSSPFFGDVQNQIKHTSEEVPTAALPPLSAPPPPRKKRNQPGTPYPDAVVIALSPKTLMATNRFVCEVCNKGFQREQNLQLHRRGHNLPWKLRQKSTKEARRRVYLCPEPTCVHHDPSRPLGDLTGIKKHFCRKHGEKKWKCDKCSKRYAVQSDWKAHSKTCGTREYRCDCGTLFSRRDSFITHRAFCDALAQECARLPIGGQMYGSTAMAGLAFSQINPQISSIHDLHCSSSTVHLNPSSFRGGGGGCSSSSHLVDHDHLVSPSSSNHLNPSSFRPPTNPSGPSTGYFFAGLSNQDFNTATVNSTNQNSFIQNKSHHGLMQLPPNINAQLPTNAPPSTTAFFNLGFFSDTNTTTTNVSTHTHSSNFITPVDHFSGNGEHHPNVDLYSGNLIGDNIGGLSSFYNNELHTAVLPQMSATALLQKASEMGATNNNGPSVGSPSIGSSFGSGRGSSSSSNNPKPPIFRGSFGSGGDNDGHLQDLMISLANANAGMLDSNHPLFGGSIHNRHHHQENSTDVVGYDGFNTNLGIMNDVKLHQSLSAAAATMGGSDQLTRDFLGVGGMVRNVGIGGGLTSAQRDQHRRGGLDIGDVFDTGDIKSVNGRLQ